MPAFNRPSGSQAISWQDFARERSESEYPELWDGLEGFWCAGLGPTGTVLFNVGPQLKDRQAAAFVNLTASAWLPMLKDGRPSIDFYHNSTTGYIDAGIGHIDTSRNEITIGGCLSLDGVRNSVSDWRMVSRALSTSGANHVYMFGALGNANNSRSRLRISGTVYTDVGPDQFWARDSTVMGCCTFDGADVKHWKNGVELLSVAHAGTLEANYDGDSAVLFLGANKSGGSAYGTMDARAYCFFIYSRVLTPSELLLLTAIPDAPLRPRPTMVSAFVPSGGPLALSATVADNDTLAADADLLAAMASTVTDDDTLVADVDLLSTIVATVTDDDALSANLTIVTSNIQMAATITDIDNRRTVSMSVGGNKTKSSVFLG